MIQWRRGNDAILYDIDIAGGGFGKFAGTVVENGFAVAAGNAVLHMHDVTQQRGRFDIAAAPAQVLCR